MATQSSSTQPTGVDALIAGVSHYAARVDRGVMREVQFILTLADDYAFIRLRDMGRPLRFLRQMAGAPPLQLGQRGFRPELVDDPNPARHYMAFVFVGYWLPMLLATSVLWAWEIAGFVRYKGAWSEGDMRSGRVGIRHGRLVRRYGAVVLPGLIAGDVAEPAPRPNQSLAPGINPR